MEIEEIRGVQGIDAAIFARLRPFITALPVHTKINLNTAPAEVLSAVLPQLEPDDIKQMIASREVLSYLDIADIKQRLPKVPATYLDTMVDAKSDFFSAIVAVSNVDADVRLMALMRRNPQNSSKWPSIIWVKTY
jgi:general secretion pathway protein K